MSSDEFNYFSLIPDGILADIFAYLKKEDLQNVRLTCKSFRKIISESPPLMKAFEITQLKLFSSLEWLMISKYSHFKLHNPWAGSSIIPILMDAVEIMGSNLLKLDINSSEKCSRLNNSGNFF